MTMKSKVIILPALLALVSAASCTKHDPFDEGILPASDTCPWILSKFTGTNVTDFQENNITFFKSNTSHAKPQMYYDMLCHLPPDDTRAYYSYDDLKAAGLLDRAVPDGKGGYYRIPTAGELMMIFPLRSDDYFMGILDFCALENCSETIMETAYLDNDDDSTVKTDGRSVSGESSFFHAADYPDSDPDFNPVFALRFKGTPQYAAYRYDMIKLKSEMVEDGHGGEIDWSLWAIRLRAVRLSPESEVELGDIMNEEYFNSAEAIELVLPMLTLMHSDYYGEQDRLYDNGYGNSGRLLSSTVEEMEGMNGKNASSIAVFSLYGYAYTAMDDSYGTHMQYPVRLLKCNQDGTL